MILIFPLVTKVIAEFVIEFISVNVESCIVKFELFTLNNALSFINYRLTSETLLLSHKT